MAAWALATAGHDNPLAAQVVESLAKVGMIQLKLTDVPRGLDNFEGLQP